VAQAHESLKPPFLKEAEVDRTREYPTPGRVVFCASFPRGVAASGITLDIRVACGEDPCACRRWRSTACRGSRGHNRSTFPISASRVPPPGDLCPWAGRTSRSPYSLLEGLEAGHS
jgi:hypothetical protein